MVHAYGIIQSLQRHKATNEYMFIKRGDKDTHIWPKDLEGCYNVDKHGWEIERSVIEYCLQDQTETCILQKTWH
jgi:hypothetical protein